MGFPSETRELPEEIIELLAEALFKDFQEHRRATVQSPPGLNHELVLTEIQNEHKGLQHPQNRHAK